MTDINLAQDLIELVKTLNPVDRGTLRRFCDNPPERKTPVDVLPIDDIDERLELIQKLEQFWLEEFPYLTQKPADEYEPFTDMQKAALLGMDIDLLRQTARLPTVAVTLLNGVCKIPPLAKLLLTKNESKKEAHMATLGTPIKTSKKRRMSSSDTYESDEPVIEPNGDAQRSIPQKDKRLDLDKHQCLVTATAHPQVMHLVAWSANARKAKREFLATYLHNASDLIFSRSAGDDMMQQRRDVRKYFGSQNGSSDKKWNMLSVDPNIHKCVANGYLGIKYLSTVPNKDYEPGISTLRLQLVWMPRRIRPLNTLGSTKDDFMGAFRGTYGDPSPVDEPLVAIARPHSGRVVQSGDIFYAKIQSVHEAKMILALKIAWAIVKITAIAGGAEVLDKVPDKSPFLDDNGQFPGMVESFMAALRHEPGDNVSDNVKDGTGV